MDLAVTRQSYGGAVVLVAVTCAVLLQSRPPRPPARFHALADAPAHAFYEAAAKAEVESRTSAARRFRGNLWSQDDEVHNKEAKFVVAYARKHHMATGGLLDALDRGMHDGWPTPGAATPDQKLRPCRPRLTY